MKRGLPILVFFLLTKFISAQYVQDWNTFLLEPTPLLNSSPSFEIAVDSSGNTFVVTGYTGQQIECRLWKLNKYGFLEWSKQIPATDHEFNSKDGKRLIASTEAVYYYSRYGIGKIDEFGNQVWFDSLNYPVTDVVISFDVQGNIVAGNNVTNNSIVDVFKIRPDGQVIYHASFITPSNNQELNYVSDKLGNVFYCINERVQIDVYQEHIYKIDTLGNVAWHKVFSGPTYTYYAGILRFDSKQNLIVISPGVIQPSLIACNIYKRLSQNGDSIAERRNILQGANNTYHLVHGDSIICVMGSQIKVIDTLGNQLHVKTFSGFSLHNLSAFENSFFIYGLDGSNSQIVALQYDYNLQLISQARSNIPNTYIDFAFSKELNISAMATLSHTLLVFPIQHLFFIFALTANRILTAIHI